MDEQENLRRVLRFDAPSHVPHTIPMWDCSYAHVNHEPYEGAGGHDSPVGTRWSDIWGVGYHKEMEGVMGYPCRHPIADMPAIAAYRPPDPDDPRLCDRIYARRREFPGGEMFVAGSHRNTIWERLYRLLGMENAMIAFSEQPDAVRVLLRMIMDFQLGIAKHYSDIGVELVSLGDDLGTQSGLLFSPDVLREFFVPEYRRLCDFYKKRGVIINFHSCGHIEPLLGVFMELGIDILNPIQANANDFNAVRRKTQGRMTLMGGIGSDLIMNGPIEAIRHAVKEQIALLGVNGGYVCAPDQYLPWPKENYEALVSAVQEYGRYPVATEA
jgi:uroporphyrinogen decarboxylase